MKKTPPEDFVCSRTPHLKYGLNRHMVEPQFREPFIMKGYRKPNMTATDCLKSIFVYYNNEAVNVWSHFLAFVAFLLKFVVLFSTELPSSDRFIWPLISYAAGILGFCLMSSIAHTFNSISPVVRNTCFFLDYAAIGIYSVGAGQAFYFYCRPVDKNVIFFRSPAVFSACSVIVSVTSTVTCCMTRHNWHSVKYLVRTASMILPFVINASPYLYRLFFCQTAIDCRFDALSMFLRHCMFYVLAAVANVTRLPESLIPGWFDVLGQSHHFMHIFTAVGAGIQFEAIKIDMQARRHILREHVQQRDEVKTAFVMLAAVVVNIAIALVFGLLSNKKKYVKDVYKTN